MGHPLDGARVKLDRAEEHLETLNAAVDEFLKVPGTATFRAEFDPVDRRHKIIYEERVPMPDRWASIAGDVVQNIRTPLDYLVQELVIAENGRLHRRHQFPILKAPADWAHNVTNPGPDDSQLGYVLPSDVARIEALQPYTPNTGKPILANLRELSNADKHRLLLPRAFHSIDTARIGARMILPLVFTRFEMILPIGEALQDQTEVARVEIKATAESIRRLITMQPERGLEMEMDVNTPGTVIFGENVQKGMRISQMREALEVVRAIIDDFAGDFT